MFSDDSKHLTTMNSTEHLYSIALTHLAGLNLQMAPQLVHALGSAQAVYEHRNNICDALPDFSPKLANNLKEWSEALRKAEEEMAFTERHHIKVLTINDNDYPQRLVNCPDAPLVLYFLGSTDLNPIHTISIIGTRRSTTYGHDIIRHLISDLRQMGVMPLVISGLAYGIDVCAHRESLANGFDTVGVLAHGLDDLYPPKHRDTAKEMIQHGGLLTEYMSHTRVDKINFVRRNRIVAGMSDATILVESAAHGGGLITCSIAQDYNRAVFAFPGAVGAQHSEGCNKLIRNNGAELITSAADLIESMGWQNDMQLQQAQAKGIERQLFPDLSEEELSIVNVLKDIGDVQLNILSVKTNIPIGQLSATLFQMEMKGIVRPLAGGSYHLLS